VAVRVFDENLARAVGAFFAERLGEADFFEMAFPLIQVVGLQREMVSLTMGNHGLRAVANEVQLLAGAEAKPRTGEIERGAGQGREAQDVAIKRATRVEVLDVQGDVVECQNVRGSVQSRWPSFSRLVLR